MYLEMEKGSLMQFILNNIHKEGTIHHYGIYLTGKYNEIILFSHKKMYIIKIHLIHLYPYLDDPRINVGETHFEIDDVEIEKNLLIEAIQWREKKLSMPAMKEEKRTKLSS